MLICVIRQEGAVGGQRPKAGPGTVFKAQTVTIGSAPDQHLQIPHAAVEPCHATLSLGPGGKLLITAKTPKAVMVNGRREFNKFLRPGDTLQLGDARVKIQSSKDGYTCELWVSEPEAGDDSVPLAVAHHGGSSGRFSISFWSWTLTIGVAAIFLLVPMGTFLAPSVRKLLRTTPLVPSDALWSSGPLHAAHRFIGNDCTSCHVNPFERVRNVECEKCHSDVQHHVDVHTTDVGLFETERCAECHFEHKQPATLVLRDQRLCTDCHAHMDQLKSNAMVENASNFGTDHPQFRVAVLTQNEVMAPGEWQAQWLDSSNPATFKENSHLKFSHVQHLNPKGIKSPTGERVMQCQDCHRPNSSGRQMMPIRMESACSGCHMLYFDERDPSTGVPHGDLRRMYTALREHFSRQYLDPTGALTRTSNTGLRRPGQEEREITLAEQRRARDWADTQALKVARELLERRVCVDCHEVTKVVGAAGFDQWQVSPVRLTANWMPRARFSHAAHITEPCTSCHDGAPRSKRSSDILMPRIEKCRTCHGDADDTTKLSSDCVMCHRFHIPARGRFDIHAAPVPATKTADARLPQ